MATHAEHNAAYRARHRERIQKQVSARYYAKPLEQRTAASKQWYDENRQHVLDQKSAYVAKVKLETLTHYGKRRKLQCCGRGCAVIDIEMLTLDHVDDNGAKHRSSGFPTGSRGFVQLKKAGFPEGYQTLCWNHQWKKEFARRRQCRLEGVHGNTRRSS
jgi:hypothetical protein